MKRIIVHKMLCYIAIEYWQAGAFIAVLAIKKLSDLRQAQVDGQILANMVSAGYELKID